MLDGLIAGAVSALVGTALGFRLRAGEPSWQQHFSQLESQVVMLKAAAGALAPKEELEGAISKATAECHSRAANIANQASAEVMEQLLAQLQSAIAGCKESFSAELREAIGELDDTLRQDLGDDLAAAITKLDQQLRDQISAEVVDATAPLISRNEVQRAFAQVAAIETQRQQEQLDAQRAAAIQQARIQEVFGAGRPQAMAVDQQLGELNAQLNQQLGVLQQRLGQIRGSRPASPEEQLVDPGVG